MNPFSVFVDCVSHKYALFDGRATRTEYWSFVLVQALIIAALFVFAGIWPFIRILSSIVTLVLLVPGIAVTIRRLHDTGRSGWWIWAIFIPLVGGLIVLAFMLFQSSPGLNQYDGVAGGTPLAGGVQAPNPELITFFQQARAAGQTEEQIVASLTGAGWQEADIRAAQTASLVNAAASVTPSIEVS